MGNEGMGFCTCWHWAERNIVRGQAGYVLDPVRDLGDVDGPTTRLELVEVKSEGKSVT